ncbi:MAG: ABC transporter substrate-binding protein [Ilumatobacteraceae bacterium]
MRNLGLTRSFVLLAVAATVAAACASDKPTSSSTTATGPATSAVTGSSTTGSTTGQTTGSTTGQTISSTADAAVDLSGVCPNPIVIQTDWFPEAEHGSLYEMVGSSYKVDTDKKRVTGPLVAAGRPTGVDIEIRAGASAIGNNTVSATTWADDSITMAYANTEAQVLQRPKTPLISVIAPLELNPQMVMWDPATYPDVKTLADLGKKNITINVFGGGVFPQVLVAEGIWNKGQVDPSFDGSPARFIAEDGKIAQQGFASAEPYSYEHVYKWGKPVAFQTISDAGFKVYSQTLAVRPDDVVKLGPCLTKFVPIVQQAVVDYVNSPDRANAIIVDAVKQYNTFWTYDMALASYSAKQQKNLGFISNGPDSTLGNIDEARVQRVIDQMREANLKVPADLKASDLFTNQFIDPKIGL